jgi:hypothetical protein
MAGPGDDDQAAVASELVLDALPGAVIDEEAVPEHCGRSLAQHAHSQ